MSKSEEILNIVDRMSQVVREISEVDEVVSDMKGKKSSFLDVVKEILSVVKNPVIAGGLAVSYYDKTRGTTDMDFVGVADTRYYETQFKKLGYKRESLKLNGLTLDMFTKGDHGVDFMFFDNEDFEKSVISRSEGISLFGYKVRVVSLEDLIVMKKLAGRTRDKADLEKLETLHHDFTYVNKWVKALS